MRDEAKPLLKGRFKLYVCPNGLFDCHTILLTIASNVSAAASVSNVRWLTVDSVRSSVDAEACHTLTP